jgi:Tetratricopeptide repeat
MLFDGGSLARTRRRGDNAGMAGDDGRAQVQLDEDTLARRRRVLGEDHPDTLASADNLAISLQGVRGQAARELGEDTLARRRRVLGEDHPDTLTSAFILASALFELGEYQAARELAEDILARRRRVLGEDHPDTGASAAFAIFLRTPRPLLKTITWVSRRRRAG